MWKRASSGSGGSGGAPELVWANPNLPNLAGTSFAAQTITESTSGWVSGKHIADYDGFIVLTHYSAENLSSGAVRGETYTYLPASVPSFNVNYNKRFWGAAADTSTTAGVGRTFEVNNGLVIGAASAGGAGFGIPLYIWGVKGALSNT